MPLFAAAIDAVMRHYLRCQRYAARTPAIAPLLYICCYDAPLYLPLSPPCLLLPFAVIACCRAFDFDMLLHVATLCCYLRCLLPRRHADAQHSPRLRVMLPLLLP